MDKTAAIESFFGEYGLTELQISTILKLFESYLKDNSIVKGNGIFEVCPKCGKVHPVIVKGGKRETDVQMHALRQKVHGRSWYHHALLPSGR